MILCVTVSLTSAVRGVAVCAHTLMHTHSLTGARLRRSLSAPGEKRSWLAALHSRDTLE